ncbi:MAG: ABC transporter ATP-binding protein, partial [Candidatus Cloacimonetes bacterium]|nr:ABC transporter ATP-binding protein [Candidatus Cloacimonadota bacterium]
YLGKKIKKYSRRIQEQISAMFSVVEEVLNSIRIVKAFRKEDDEFRAFEKINRRHLRQWQRSQIYAALNVPLSELNTTITGVVVVIIGGGMILNPEASFSLGDFTAFLFAIFSMLHPLKSITQLYTEVKKATVSMDRIALVLNQVSSIQDAPDAIAKPDFEQEIVFDKVSFYYQPGKYVIRDLSLTIPKGQKIAFVGASGGGKTTITNLINRMYDVKEGRILLDGIDIRKIKLDDLRSLFGVVTQDSVLFTKTVRENIAYGSRKPLSEAEIIAAAQIAHADEFIQSLPDKYDQLLDIKGLNLSGGQRQRLCIARAIVGNPPILIFDEATSALDTESERKVQDAIDEATRNRTVLLVAHRLSTILKADKIVVLEGGRIAGIGSHEELLASCPRYQTLYNLQFNL